MKTGAPTVESRRKSVVSHDRFLRRARRQRGLTQAQLAVDAELPERAIQRLEAGTGSVGNLMAALAALGLEIHPAPENGRQHISTLNGVRIRKREATWSTPTHILEALYSVFGTFDLDPCSPSEPTVRCRRWYTEDDDGLTKPWRGVKQLATVSRDRCASNRV